MMETVWVLLFASLYNLLVMSSGTLIVYLGYRLFAIGVYKNGSELDVTWNNNRVLLKKAAPGTFFALFGATIIVVSLLHGPEVEMGDGPAESADSLETNEMQVGSQGDPLSPLEELRRIRENLRRQQLRRGPYIRYGRAL